jgi:phosphatidate cytidylyltransferase
MLFYHFFINITFISGLYELYKIFQKNLFSFSNKEIKKFIQVYFCIILYTWLMVLLNIELKIEIMNIILYNSVSDMIQYVFGKYFGYYRLTTITTKTLEGYSAGLIITRILFSHLDETFIYLNFLGMIGGLFSSYLKRNLGLKHWSNLLNSHGGVGDRLDSLVFPLFVFLIIKSN